MFKVLIISWLHVRMLSFNFGNINICVVLSYDLSFSNTQFLFMYSSFESNARLPLQSK